MDPNPYHHIHNIINGRQGRFSDATDWQAFLDRIFQEQLQGIAYLNLKQSEVPKNVIRKLEQAYYASMAANTYRLKAIEELEAQLANDKISIMVIKGAALLDSVYPDPGMRPMEDIDLMINPEDFSTLKKVLIQCGYIKDSVFPHMFRKQGILIDVHTSLLHTDRIKSRKAIFQADMQRVWNDSLPWQPGFRHVRRLDDATHIIYLVHHMIKHSFSKMIWLMDIFQIMKNQDDLFWKKMEQKTIIYHQEKPVAYMLYILSRMIGVYPPQGSALRDYDKKLTLFEKAILNQMIRGESIGDMGNVLWLFCLPTVSQQIRFLGETMFPQKVVLRRELSLAPNIHARNLYAYRASQILRRLIHNIRIVAKGIVHR